MKKQMTTGRQLKSGEMKQVKGGWRSLSICTIDYGCYRTAALCAANCVGGRCFAGNYCP